MKNKKYRLKAWDKVANHHFIKKETWDKLANEPELEIERLKGIFEGSVIVAPKGELFIRDSSYLVDKNDLYLVEEKKTELEKSPTPTEKTYTKDEIREAGVRVMMDSNLDEDSAVASALAISKLINRL